VRFNEECILYRSTAKECGRAEDISRRDALVLWLGSREFNSANQYDRAYSCLERLACWTGVGMHCHELPAIQDSKTHIHISGGSTTQRILQRPRNLPWAQEGILCKLVPLYAMHGVRWKGEQLSAILRRQSGPWLRQELLEIQPLSYCQRPHPKAS